jgi:subtilase family serine protease
VQTNTPLFFRKLTRRLIYNLCFMLVVIVSVGAYLHSQPETVVAAVQPLKIAYHKQLRTIVRHRFKAACSSTKANVPHCLADILVNTNGQTLTEATPNIMNGNGPLQFHTAYNLPCTPGGPVQSICSTPTTYGPETIAIVDLGGYGGSGSIESNLATFDSYYNLPACTTADGCLSIVNQDNQTSPLPAVSTTDPSGWAAEMNLDVQTAHMICQSCQIKLYESVDLISALNTAAINGATSVSNSWSFAENGSFDDSDVEHPGVAIVAATGDDGSDESGGNYPADNPDVVAAAGTTLQLNTDNSYSSEAVWSGSGGGCASDSSDSAPSWQTGLSNWTTAGCGSEKAVGDLSADADPSTGMSVYFGSSWGVAGGTSLAAPIIASAFALAGGVPSSTYAPSMIYQNFNSLNSHDITSGNDCTSSVTANCTAGTGFDTPSGMGSINGIDGLEAQPLTTPGSFDAVETSTSSIDLSWTPSTSTYGVAGYNVYRNGTLIDTTTSNNYSDTGLAANTVYNYTISAYDNSSDVSESASASNSTFEAEDINDDSHINLLDLSLLASKYGQTGSSLGRADINGDGKVDLLDLSLLASKYGSE